MKNLLSTLLIMISIANPADVHATDFCAPVIFNGQYPQDLANRYCPGVCTAVGAVWNGNWSPTSSMLCGTGNPANSVCGCNITINSRDLCASETLNSNDGAKEACPATCAKEHGTWNGNWIGTTGYKCSGSNTTGSICGCNYTGCSEIVLDYVHDDINPPNWQATAWYTPCGSNQEAGTAWRATNWDNNTLSIAKGTRIRIGQAGKIYSSIDKVVTEPEFHILCRGSFGTSRSNEDPPCCRDASIPLPCTNVIVEYTPEVHWEASIDYMPCNKCEQQDQKRSGIAFTDNPYFPHNFSITSGTRVQIGPIATLVNYLDQEMSGSEVTILCYGKILGQGTGCCIKGKPDCPPKSSSTSETKDKDKDKDKDKEDQKTPAEEKAPLKTKEKVKPPKS